MAEGDDKESIYFDLADNEIYFNTENEISISDLIESLKGLERLIRYNRKAFSNVLGAEISQIEVFVEQLQSGSLTERILLRLVFENEEELDKFLAKWRHKLKELGPMKGAGIAAGVLIAGLVGYGMFLSATRPGPTQQTTIDFSNSNIIVVGAEAFETDPDSFRMAIESAVSDKKALARDSHRFVEPARKAGGDIQFDGNSQATIEEERIQSLPDEPVSQPEAIDQAYTDVDLQIRASDRDRHNKGWAGVIRDIVERRVPLEVADGVDLEQLSRHPTVRADVIVTSKFDARSSGDKYRPSRIYVQRLVPMDERE